MSKPVVIVVTGSNRGIGKGIVSLLAKQTLDRPLIIYATSRAGTDTGIEACGINKIYYFPLDITNHDSIRNFITYLHKPHEGIDVLINNAAVSNDYRENPEYAAQTIWNNYGGTRDMCAAFLSPPHRPSRIVNVTSGLNALSSYGTDIQAKIRTASTVADIDALAHDYLRAMSSWGTTARSYKVSKALINTLTVVLAQQYPNVLINSCCPGWTNTEMGKQGGPEPPKTPEEGAMTAVRLAIGDLGASGDEDGGLGRDGERVSGMFFENENVVVKGWGEGKNWMET